MFSSTFKFPLSNPDEEIIAVISFLPTINPLTPTMEYEFKQDEPTPITPIEANAWLDDIIKEARAKLNPNVPLNLMYHKIISGDRDLFITKDNIFYEKIVFVLSHTFVYWFLYQYDPSTEKLHTLVGMKDLKKEFCACCFKREYNEFLNKVMEAVVAGESKYLVCKKK